MMKKQRKWMVVCVILTMIMGMFVTYPMQMQAKTIVKSIQLNLSEKTMCVGQKISLKVKKVTPSKASAAVTWSSSDENVAIVTQTGTVTAKNLGTAKIIAVSKNNKKVEEQCTITVTETGDVRYSGKYQNVTWKIYQNGLLDIKGTGEAFGEANASANKNVTNEEALSYTYNMPGWYKYASVITRARVDIKDITNLNYAFDGLSLLKEVDLSKLDTSKVKSMYSMFYNCTSLKKIDVSNFDTSNVNNMANMFYNCRNLQILDVGNFDTSKVVDMSGMFYNCMNLKSLDLSSFNTEKVKYMGSKEDELEDYSFLNYKAFRASYTYGMFANCMKLKELNLSSFDTSNVSDMGYLFYGCKSLEKADESKFNTEKVTCMSGMFSGCKRLKEINLSSFDTTMVKRMTSMFYGCEKLKEIDVSSFDTENVCSIKLMFAKCKSIETLDLSKLDFSSVEENEGYFRNVGFVYKCTKLQTILTPKKTNDSEFLLDGNKWVDSQGTEYNLLPSKAMQSITLTRKEG